MASQHTLLFPHGQNATVHSLTKNWWLTLLRDAWMLVLSGVISIVFGGAVLLMPGAGALALVWLIGAYALLFGLILVVLAFRLKQLNDPLAH